MIRNEVINLILEIAGQQDAFDILESTFVGISKDALSLSLLECGIIPERYYSTGIVK